MSLEKELTGIMVVKVSHLRPQQPIRAQWASSAAKHPLSISYSCLTIAPMWNHCQTPDSSVSVLYRLLAVDGAVRDILPCCCPTHTRSRDEKAWLSMVV